ncbi:MAG: hypothetical protein J2P36_08335 [Ktedonobacteraceae bacterium]|nr:hypothetical protein [Ktedonobacteraceae bacterium]
MRWYSLKGSVQSVSGQTSTDFMLVLLASLWTALSFPTSSVCGMSTFNKRRANPALQRRQVEQAYQRTIQQLQGDLEKVRTDAEHYQKEAQMAKLGACRPGQEVTQLKKAILALQRQVACLEEQLPRCTCGARSNPMDFVKREDGGAEQCTMAPPFVPESRSVLS